MTNAPRVTIDDIEAQIAYEYYLRGDQFTLTPVIGPAWKEISQADITPLSCLTFYILHLRNGFIVVGTSACVSIENFDEAIERKVARDKAVAQLWPLLGYQLKERLYQANIETRHEPRGLCPKGCGALIYLGHAHMCSAQREV